jgi:cytidylate kinase
MTLIALSASYGAGSTRIAPALAERLGVPFVDRAIPLEVAKQLHVSADEAAAHEEGGGGSFLERVLRGFIGTDPGAPAPLPAAEAFSSEDFRRATEEVLLHQAATGAGVILGRGSVVVLRENPRALRVRLDGPPDRRVSQAIRLGRSLDREDAERALRQFDRTHAAYLQQLYGVDIRDSTLYHLVLDSTRIELEACVEIIAKAADSLAYGADVPSADGLGEPGH